MEDLDKSKIRTSSADDIKRCLERNNKQLLELKERNDENLQLKVRLSVTQKELKDYIITKENLANLENELKQTRKRLDEIQASTSYKIGSLFVQAFTRPGKKTFLFPYHLVRTLLASKAAKE